MGPWAVMSRSCQRETRARVIACCASLTSRSSLGVRLRHWLQARINLPPTLLSPTASMFSPRGRPCVFVVCVSCFMLCQMLFGLPRATRAESRPRSGLLRRAWAPMPCSPGWSTAATACDVGMWARYLEWHTVFGWRLVHCVCGVCCVVRALVVSVLWALGCTACSFLEFWGCEVCSVLRQEVGVGVGVGV